MKSIAFHFHTGKLNRMEKMNDAARSGISKSLEMMVIPNFWSTSDEANQYKTKILCGM